MLTAVLLWLLGLALALGASEVLVHSTAAIGRRLHLTAAVLGLLIALGADSPEVTSALVAAVRGSSDVSLGVVVGSNVYNLAGLLGLAALLAGAVRTRAHRLPLDTVFNLLLTAALAVLVVVPGAQRPMAVVLLMILATYAVIEVVGPDVVPVVGRYFPLDDVPAEDVAAGPARERVPLVAQAAVAIGAVVVIVAASEILVAQSLYLGPRLGIPHTVMGTIVLAIATSIPNTWAAVSLARRHHPEAVIGAAFNSNSINAAMGAGVPALLVPLHVASVTRTLDIGWLGLMTLVAATLCAVRGSLRRVDGALLLGLYALFLIVQFAAFR